MEPRLFGPEMLADPYPIYRRLRVADPMHWHAPFGAWFLTRYDDVAAAFHDPHLSSARAEPMRALAPAADIQPFFDYLATRMDFQDPPAHTRLRGPASHVFAPRAIEALRPRIQGIVDQLLDAVQGEGRMDIIRDLAFPLPGRVIADLLGVPAGDCSQLKRWSDAFVGFFKTVPSEATHDDYRQSMQAADDLGSYYRNILDRQRDQDGEGLLASLARSESDGNRLSDVELSANVTLLLHAGHETTTHLIGNGMWALFQHPEELQKLRDEPALVPSAVEEFLRYDCAVQMTSRQAREDYELLGHPVKRGQLIFPLIGSANRDPDHFAEPDRLDVGRSPNKHLGFGHGPHFCLGAYLARLEAQVVVQSLLERLPRLRLEGDEPPERQEHFILRGLKSLPVVF